MNLIINWGLYLLALLLPWQTRWIWQEAELHYGYWEYGTISLYATDLLVLALLILTVLFLPKNWRDYKWPLSFAGLLLFFVGLSILFSPNWQLSCYLLTRLILGLGLFWVVLQSRIKTASLWLVLLLGSLPPAVLGIWQFLTQGGFANKWLGLALHSPIELGTSVVEVLGADGQWERWLRAYGSLDHPNMLGGLLALAILVLLTILSVAKDPKNNHLKEIFYYFCLPIFTAGLFFSFSRAAFLALGVGLLSLLALYWRQFKKLLPGLIIILLMALTLAWSYRPLLISRFIDPPRLEVKSIDERLNYLDNAWQLIAANWLEGVGLGNHTWAVFSQIEENQISWWYQPVHNTYLLVWSEIGLLGLAAFLALLGYLLYQQYRLVIVKREETRQSYLPLLLALLTLLLFDHWLWSLHFGVIFFWLMLGLIAKNRQIS